MAVLQIQQVLCSIPRVPPYMDYILLQVNSTSHYSSPLGPSMAILLLLVAIHPKCEPED